MSMRIARRELLRRLGWGGVGAGALVLIGCGEDDPPPAAAPAIQQPAEQERDAPEAQPVAAEQAQQEQAKSPQPVTAAAQQERQQAEHVQQAELAQQQQVQAQSQVAQQQAQQQQVQGEERPRGRPSAESEERRLLIPEVDASGYELEDPAFDPVPGARVDYGVIDGAGYRIELPEEWNGELLLWAHGFRGLNEAGDGYDPRLTFDELPRRDEIIGLGYGWATSTYRANGYVPGLGVDDLLKVKDQVGEIARPPTRTYCLGGSMGGATAQLMAQEFPREITAAISYCGALGNIAVVDYTVAWNMLAHWFVGGPPMRLDPLGMLDWAAPLGVVEGGQLLLSPIGEQFSAVIEHFTGGPRWGFREGFARQWETMFALGALLWPDVLEGPALEPGRVLPVPPDQLPFDTTQHHYEAQNPADPGLDLERLNAEVVRFQADPVRRADPGVGVASGELRVPLLALKTTGDLFTPIHLERDYQQLVQSAGFESRLVVQAIRRAGHCNFSAAESLAALTRMVTWLSFGLAPAGDDLSGDLTKVGTRFTDPFDVDDPEA